MSSFVRVSLTIIATIGLVGISKVSAQKGHTEGHEIKIKLTEFKNDTLYLGYPMGAQQYIRDTAYLDAKTGIHTFKGTKSLAPGVYLIVMPPDNQYFQVMIGEHDQNFSLAASTVDPYKTGIVKGSKENDVFFKYMNFIGDLRKEAENLQTEMKTDTTKKVKNMAILNSFDKRVKTYQSDLVKNNPNTSVGVLIRSAMEVELPEFKDSKDKQMDQYLFYKQHYFDNFEMGNPALLRTPVMHQRITQYIEKLTPQHPDSINESLDRILDLIKPAKESFQYYYVQFLNDYAKNKIVGFDAVYVHLAKKYIESGQVDSFIDKEQRDKILKNANTLFPILIGKKAPNVSMFLQDSSRLALYDVKSKFTILYFWDPDCGHCKKSIPHIVDFYKKFKDRGVKMYCVCQKLPNEIGKCWDAIKERDMGEWINVVDPYQLSRARTLYNVEVTPKLFILDENKVIISKDIGSEQLDEVMERYISDEEKKKKE
jgi:thiol-disulfide isomerase/thioredoxin